MTLEQLAKRERGAPIPFFGIFQANGEKVDVYFNFQKRCFSVRYKGKVIAHTNQVILNNAQFVVSEAGRQRVLKDKRKNVHAVVRGSVSNNWLLGGRSVKYNPYAAAHFVDAQSFKPVHESSCVRLVIEGQSGRMYAL